MKLCQTALACFVHYFAIRTFEINYRNENQQSQYYFQKIIINKKTNTSYDSTVACLPVIASPWLLRTPLWTLYSYI